MHPCLEKKKFPNVNTLYSENQMGWMKCDYKMFAVVFKYMVLNGGRKREEAEEEGVEGKKFPNYLSCIMNLLVWNFETAKKN